MKTKIIVSAPITTTEASLSLFNSGAGTYSVMFNGQYVSSSAGTTARGTSYLTAAYNQLIATTTTAAAFGSGKTLTAGVYAIAGAGSIAGRIYFYLIYS